jgi:hypothetical protein
VRRAELEQKESGPLRYRSCVDSLIGATTFLPAARTTGTAPSLTAFPCLIATTNAAGCSSEGEKLRELQDRDRCSVVVTCDDEHPRLAFPLPLRAGLRNHVTLGHAALRALALDRPRHADHVRHGGADRAGSPAAESDGDAALEIFPSR